MPKYYCDYCDTYLTHDSEIGAIKALYVSAEKILETKQMLTEGWEGIKSYYHFKPSVRKTHCNGRKHKDNVKFYYQKWMEEQAQSLIDATTAAFKAGKIQSGQFAPNTPKPAGVMIPPPPNMLGPPRPGMPGQPMPVMGPPPMGPMAAPIPGPMPVMPPAAMPPAMMVPGMRGMRPPGGIGPMMQLGPVPGPGGRDAVMIP